MCRSFFVLICALLLSNGVFGQDQCACATEPALTKSFAPYFSNKDYQGGKQFWEKLPAGTAPACRLEVGLQLFNIAYNLRDTNAMQATLLMLKDLPDSTCNAEGYANLLWRWSQLLALREKYDSALAYAQHAMMVAEKGKFLNVQTAVLGTIAKLMFSVGEPQRAVNYQRRCAMLSDEIDHPNTAIAYGNLGAMYGGMFDATGDTAYLDSLVMALTQSNIFIRSSAVTLEQLSYNYANIAQVAMLLNQFERGLLYCDSALAAPVVEDGSRVSIYNIMYNIYAGLNDIPNAVRYADSANTLAMRTQDTRTIVSTMTSLYEAYKLAGNTALALSTFEKLVIIRDSINASERIAAITEVEEKYNKTKNEKTINELNQEREISSLNIKLLTAGIIGALLIILLVVIFFRQSVLKSKQVQIETEQRLNRARMNPHFFFNTLSALQTSALTERDPVKLGDLLSKYSRIMRSTLESTFEDLVSVEDEERYLHLYLQLQQFRCNNSFNYSILIDEAIDPSEILLPGMIIQPFVENAIEHGFSGIEREGRIEIAFALKLNALVITVTDNGAGVTDKAAHKEHKSRATEITRDRLFLLNKKHKSAAAFTVTNNAGNPGTTVTITLPVLK